MADGAIGPPTSRRGAALPTGLVPRYLSREESAAYLGVSPETFDHEIKAGWWPPARRRGAQGGRLTWDRLALDAAADQASGLTLRLTDTPAEVDRQAAAEAAAMEGARHVQTRQQRPKQRPAQAR